MEYARSLRTYVRQLLKKTDDVVKEGADHYCRCDRWVPHNLARENLHVRFRKYPVEPIEVIYERYVCNLSTPPNPHHEFFVAVDEPDQCLVSEFREPVIHVKISDVPSHGSALMRPDYTVKIASDPGKFPNKLRGDFS